ncbi:MAG TPA: RodZ domain-containing protein [Bryobacteraceae bacterium]|nr:RodZ domain-containing protein [Bryobacteraceae bacterium]
MARLRIRVELSRGGVGVPLHKLASVIAESQKFLNLLTEDVRIDKQRGEWLGFDFDRESLNFTAEYVGAVTPQQVEAFNAAFDGTTSLRRDTIAQFLQITDAIGEDEVIGFGLYLAEDTAEPTEWRCLSRRDALRIADEVQVLLGAGQAPHLPAASDPGLGARMFGDRRDRSVSQNHLTEYVREVESGLSNRIQRVETQVQKHAGLIHDLHAQSATTETSFRNLLSTFEGFCNQATLNIERMAPAALPAAWERAPRVKLRGLWVAGAGAFIAASVVIGLSLWPTHDTTLSVKQDHAAASARNAPTTEPATVSAATVKAPAPTPANAGARPPANRPAIPVAAANSPVQTTSSGLPMEIVLDATEPSWISMKDQDGKALFAQLLVPGSARTVTLQGSGTLRTGNAGGLVVQLNGNPIGPVGPNGKVREIEFKNGSFTINSF